MTQLTGNEREALLARRQEVLLHCHCLCLEGSCQSCMARVRRSSRGGGRISGSDEHHRHLRPKAPSEEYIPTSPELLQHLPLAGLRQPHGFGQQSLPLPQPSLVPLRNKPGFAGPQSPNSTASTGSFTASNLGLSIPETGSVASLERKRNWSPHDLTPTYSLPSLGRSATLESLNSLITDPDHLAGLGDAIPDRLSQQEPLAGIRSIYEPDTPNWNSYHGDETPTAPAVMLPSALEHVRDFDEPWSALDVEEDGSIDILGLNRSDSINSRTEQLSLSPRPNPPHAARPGRRHGPLSPHSRQNASDVRKERSCLRCFVYKETCDTSKDICQNCSNKLARTWKLGCVRPRLSFRTYYLLPDVLASRLERRYVDSFIQNRGWHCTDKPRFAIPLEIGLGSRLNVPVREYLPVTDLKRPAFLPESSEKAVPIDMYDLPVRISCEIEAEAIGHIRSSLSLWYKQTIGCTHKSDWAWHWFVEKIDPFPGSIMEIICEYFDPKLSQHKPLKEALAMSFFNYISINTFLVEKDCVEAVAAKMEMPPPLNAEYISPSTVNLYIKMLMLPPLRDVVTRTLKNLESLLLEQQRPRAWRRDLVFCISFIVLAYLGRTQASLLQVAAQPIRDHRQPLTHAAAEAQVLDMERELADLVIKYHQQFMVPSSRRKTANEVATQLEQECEEHAISFGLMEKVRRVCSEQAHTRPRSLHPDCSSVERFMAKNTTRICWKFVSSIVPGVNIKSDPDTEMHM